MLLIITYFITKSDSLITMVICKKSFYSQTVPSVVYKFALCLRVYVHMWICKICLCSVKRGNISIKIPEKVPMIPSNYESRWAILVPAMPILFMTSYWDPFLRWKKYMDTSIELILIFTQNFAVFKVMTNVSPPLIPTDTTVPVLQMRELRFRETKWFVQSITVDLWQIHD